LADPGFSKEFDILKTLKTTITLFSLLCVALPVQAYIGPGAGISVVGSLLGLLGTVVLAVAVIFLWPIRRLLKRGGGDDVDAEEAPQAAEAAPESVRDTAPERAGDK
jgi:hypothetical protein